MSQLLRLVSLYLVIRPSVVTECYTHEGLNLHVAIRLHRVLMT